MIARLSPAQERGLILLIAIALLASGVLLLVQQEFPSAPLPSQVVVLHEIPVLLPSFIDSGPVDVNVATAAELITLPGIGPALAQRILEYRAAHGFFESIQDLAKVSGIGPQTIAGLEGLAIAGQAPTD